MSRLPRPLRVLVVDDEPRIRHTVAAKVRELGHEADEAESLTEGRVRFRAGADLVVLDHRLPDGSGFDLLEVINEFDAAIPVIMMTGHSTISGAVEAMNAGAYHYLAKPVDLSELGALVNRALEATRLRRELRGLRVERSRASASVIVGRSPQIERVRELISKIAVSPGSTVLLTGESGTGKDLAARALHDQSSRASGPFLTITCSALPSELLESELFGHERGAFTDAKQRKLGLIEHAEGGTTFLDEIGELELSLQAKLLRLLESKTFRRIGSPTDQVANTRIVAATNVNLREAVRRGSFREDLYYRLAVLTVRLPPLREREGDVEMLSQYFIGRFNEEFGKSVRELAPDALHLLRSYPWPGNVRELKNAVERAVLLAPGRVLERRDFDMLGATAISESDFRLPESGLDMRTLELNLVRQALKRTNGNRTHAAKLLGMNRDQIRYRIEQFGLEDADDAAGAVDEAADAQRARR